MSDFYQTGAIATMHRLGAFKVETIEKELESFAKLRPIALVLPCLYSELEGPALRPIVEELTRVRYIRQVVISLDRADERQYQHARDYFSILPQETTIIWNDGRRMSNLRHILEAHRLRLG